MTQFQDRVLTIADGIYVSEQHERIARIIKDYDPELELAYIPPKSREPGDIPFAVIHRPAGRQAYVVSTHEHCDERILESLFNADNKHGDVQARLDAHNLAIELVKAREELDREEEARDFVKTVIKSPLNRYQHKGVRYD